LGRGVCAEWVRVQLGGFPDEVGKGGVGVAPGDMDLKSNALSKAGARSEGRFPGPT
jgi:hypothetical protein